MSNKTFHAVKNKNEIRNLQPVKAANSNYYYCCWNLSFHCELLNCCRIHLQKLPPTPSA